MRANYDPQKRRNRHLAEQEAKRRASQATEEGGDASQESQAEPAANPAQDQPVAAGDKEIAMGRGRGGGRKQQPEQERQEQDPREDQGPKAKKPQRKGDLVPVPMRASRAGGKMAKDKASERDDQMAPRDVAQEEVYEQRETKRVSDRREAETLTQQQRTTGVGHCPGPKRRGSRKQRD